MPVVTNIHLAILEFLHVARRVHKRIFFSFSIPNVSKGLRPEAQSKKPATFNIQGYSDRNARTRTHFCVYQHNTAHECVLLKVHWAH